MNGIRNSVTLIGNLGKDPELRQLPNGSWVARLSLATNEIYKNQKGDKITETQWHNLVAWGKTAELMNNLLKKGKEVAVRGKLTYRNYQDKDGVQRSVSEILVNEFTLLS
ncbi:MAG TPA: single-stranded DNA-binding protein [Saprospiraceae bacterium]|nr:single-stranded DNA-binding protein [Saprospiraceae bacterium]HMP24860.1 single-stranded DNA-binding protein [Saprospiraceae bacterium]